MTSFDVELDTSGQNCPMPIMNCKKAVRKMESGQVLHLIATDPGSRDDIPELLQQIDCEMIDSNDEGGAFHFYIKKG